ncbi:MAG: ClpXP protease specificity-enhancing factor [Gammaproteobacteria bacterium HGW-Gammaproteobacteria-1]|jgi:stringent starvation protein B|nr:MAG: ClpXP protease specificity-enhancing factor [Gammaproteobacteria bacterium HGW-Gammaproteobacteria-1]
MTSSRPYLLRALYEWIVDNEMTPHILVDAAYPGTSVPQQFVENGKIVLNVGPNAVQGLSLGNEAVGFSARFGGIANHIVVPMGAVQAIYARENGRGMVFAEEDGSTPPPPSEPEGGKKPSLRVVK